MATSPRALEPARGIAHACTGHLVTHRAGTRHTQRTPVVGTGHPGAPRGSWTPDAHLSWVVDTPASLVVGTGRSGLTCRGYWTLRPHLSWVLDTPASLVVGNRHDKSHLTWLKDATSRRAPAD